MTLIGRKNPKPRDLFSMEPFGYGQNSFRLMGPPTPVRVPGQRPFAPSVTSVTLRLMMRLIMRLYWGLCTDQRYGRGKPRKTSTRRPSDEGCVTSHRLRWDPLPPNDVTACE